MDKNNLTEIISAIISLFGLAAAVLKLMFKLLRSIFSNVESLETSISPGE